MKQGAKLLVCLLGGFGCCATSNGLADTQPSGPYDEIIARNAFALKPLPPPQDPSEVNKQPPVKIILTGITTIIGKRALMETPGPAPKPGQAATPKLFYMLSEGEKQGDIEVLKIDERAGSVKLINAGQELTLTFDKDGAKLPATQAPLGAPGMPGALPGVPPPAGFAPPVKTAGAATPGFPAFPTRQVRTGNEGTAPGANFGGVNPAYNSGGVSMPSFASATPLQTQPALHETGMTPEEQAILMETSRLQTQNQVASGKLPPIPPTPLTPSGSPGSLPPGENPRPTLPRPGFPPLPGMPGVPGS